LPQAPQFAGSVASVVHTPPQATSLDGQATQLPPWQRCVDEQMCPQAPQFCQSPLKIVQVLPHKIWPLAQRPRSLMPSVSS
jgi:hypothetical protein